MGAACSRPAADGAGSAGAAAGLQATEPWENTVHHGAAGACGPIAYSSVLRQSTEKSTPLLLRQATAPRWRCWSRV